MSLIDGFRRKLVNRLLPSRRSGFSARSFAESLASSDENYIAVCSMAARDPEQFANFRRNPGYTNVLEHVSEAQGREYLKLLSPAGRAIRKIEDVARYDVLGNPVTMRIDHALEISPTTLRYLKVADDIEKLFGDLEGANVIEIGVGYGGQCRVMDAVFQIGSYTLVDLRPVLNLAGVFLDHFPLRCSVKYLTMNELAPNAYDLLISNYAFSELSREIQETYFVKAMRQTARGYITHNDIAPPEYNSMTCNELSRRLNARILPEQPQTHRRNHIVIWGESAGRQ